MLNNVRGKNLLSYYLIISEDYQITFQGSNLAYKFQ